MICIAVASGPRRELSLRYLLMDELSQAIAPLYPPMSGGMYGGFGPNVYKREAAISLEAKQVSSQPGQQR